MFIACPVVRIGKPFSFPILTSLEKFIQLFDKGRSSSKQRNESFSIVRYIESVMPGISLHIVVGKYVDSLKFGYF